MHPSPDYRDQLMKLGRMGNSTKPATRRVTRHSLHVADEFRFPETEYGTYIAGQLLNMPHQTSIPSLSTYSSDQQWLLNWHGLDSATWDG